MVWVSETVLSLREWVNLPKQKKKKKNENPSISLLRMLVFSNIRLNFDYPTHRPPL